MPSKSRPADTAALVSEQAIRERAYLLWEQAGRPEGTGEHYWHLALQEATRELVATSGNGVAAATKSASSKNPQELPPPVKAGRASKASKASKARLLEGEAGKPKAKAKAGKSARKASPKPRAAMQTPK